MLVTSMLFPSIFYLLFLQAMLLSYMLWILDWNVSIPDQKVKHLL